MQKVAHPSQSVGGNGHRQIRVHQWGELAFAPFHHTKTVELFSRSSGVGTVVVILVNQFSDDGDVSVFIPSQ